MRLGMLIDIDHMSQAAVDQTLALAVSFGYPVNSGHNGIRGAFGADSQNERALRPDQYAKTGALHGMAGVGSGGIDAYSWAGSYNAVTNAMGSTAIAGFGTDTDGFALGMPPSSPQFVTTTNPNFAACVQQKTQDYGSNDDLTASELAACKARVQSDCSQQYPPITACVKNCGRPLIQYNQSFPMSTDGTHSWNYNSDGVAHYGMIWDFVQDVRNVPAETSPGSRSGADLVDNNLMLGADYLFVTWKTCEIRKANVH